jgi:hypothetical protein
VDKDRADARDLRRWRRAKGLRTIMKPKMSRKLVGRSTHSTVWSIIVASTRATLYRIFGMVILGRDGGGIVRLILSHPRAASSFPEVIVVARLYDQSR